jgi:hypothetical protein
VTSNTSKTRKLVVSSDATSVPFVDEAKILLARCLVSLNMIDVAYFYEAIGSASIPGSLSHLLCVTDQQLMRIYQSCGFFNVKRNRFSDTIFQGFIEGLDVQISITRYKKPTSKIRSLLVNIGQGSYPAKPLQQVRNELQPPNHHLKKEERQLVTSLLKLCCPDATPLMPSEDTATTSIDATISIQDTTTNSTSTMCHKFNIQTQDKAALVMELVRDMKSPEKVPVRRQLLGGPNVTIHSLNNKTKKYIQIPQCKDGATADTALRKYKVVERIVETDGSGIKSPEGIDVGALWLGKWLTETNCDEFITCSSRAGIMIAARMSPEATAAMWHDALVTKTKQRKIARHLFSWFGQPITAKEKDVDALAGKAYVKRRTSKHSFVSWLGKKESDDDIKRRRRDITSGFQFLLLDGLAIPMCFLADHGNVAWRAGLTIVASEANGQGEPVKLAHLLGKDLYNVLENTVNPDLRMGFWLLQSSWLLVVGRGAVKECILVPRNPIGGYVRRKYANWPAH